MTIKSNAPLSPSQVNHFNENGWLVTDTLVDKSKQLQAWCDEVQGWSDEGDWLHYRELTEHGPKLCRTEYFTPFHSNFRSLLTEGIMVDTASALLGDQAVLFKEK